MKEKETYFELYGNEKKVYTTRFTNPNLPPFPVLSEKLDLKKHFFGESSAYESEISYSALQNHGFEIIQIPTVKVRWRSEQLYIYKLRDRKRTDKMKTGRILRECPPGIKIIEHSEKKFNYPYGKVRLEGKDVGPMGYGGWRAIKK